MELLAASATKMLGGAGLLVLSFFLTSYLGRRAQLDLNGTVDRVLRETALGGLLIMTAFVAGLGSLISGVMAFY